MRCPPKALSFALFLLAAAPADAAVPDVANSFYVPQALQRGGLTIIPVPVYHPEATEILGEKVYRSLAEIPGEIDLVDVFRKPSDLAGHLDDILAAKPKAVWLQAGISDDAFAEKLARAGIVVVQDRCLMVEYRRRHG